MTNEIRREPLGVTSRRDMVKGLGLGLAATTAASSLSSGPAIAQAVAPAVQLTVPVNVRNLPRSGEAVPVIGLGTFLTFDVIPGQDRSHLKDVVRTYWNGGACVIDTSPLYGTAEYSIGSFASELGIGDRMFVSNKIWSTGEYLADESHAARSLQQSLGRLWRRQIDVMHCHSLTNVDPIIPILQAWKKEGRIRFIGVSHHENVYHDAVASWIERGVVDLIQVNYSIYNRGAEDRVLSIAADRGIGVLVNMPLEKARLHKVVEGRPLPDFAKEFEAENWAQFFLKWVSSRFCPSTTSSSARRPGGASSNCSWRPSNEQDRSRPRAHVAVRLSQDWRSHA